MPSRVSSKYRDTLILQRQATAADFGKVPGVIQRPNGGEIDHRLDCNWINLETFAPGTIPRCGKVVALSLLAPEGTLTPASPGQQYVSDVQRGIETHVIELRRDSVTSQLTNKCRALWFGERLNVLSKRDSGPHGREIILTCKSNGMIPPDA